MEYGKRLNPEHSPRTPTGIKGTRQKIIVTHKPSAIDQAQELLVRFPNLGNDDVIIPGMANLSFIPIASGILRLSQLRMWDFYPTPQKTMLKLFDWFEIWYT